MKKTKLAVTVALCAMLAVGCGVSKKDTLITINDEPITKQQYEKAFDAVANNSMFTQMGIDVKKDPNSFLHLMLKDRVINELIVRNLLDQEIEKRKIKVSENDINDELRTIIDKVGSKEKFNEILKQNGISSAQFKKDLQEEVKIKKLVDTLAMVSVSDADVKKYYNENVEKFKYPDKVKASHILISANPDELKELIVSDSENKKLSEEEINVKIKSELATKKEKAQKLHDLLKQDPTQFAKIARENSDDTVSAKQGGDLGYFSAQEMVEPFSKAAFNQAPNTIGEIVATPYGYHIILVTDRIKAGVEPLEKVQPEIKMYLENQERVKILQNFVDNIKSQANIIYNDASYNPEEIQKQLKEQAKKNPALMDSQKSAAE